MRLRGGGSLISFPALLAVGYPAVTANVTNTVALVPGYLGGSLAYRPELPGQRTRVRTLGLISLGGGLLGSVVLVVGPASLFRQIVPWLILFSCGLLLFQPIVKRLAGDQQSPEAQHPSWLLLPTQFLAAVYGGYFGAGVGVLMLATLGIFLHDTLQRLNALKGLLSLIINAVAALFFAFFGPVTWLPVVIMAASLAGGTLESASHAISATRSCAGRWSSSAAWWLSSCSSERSRSDVSSAFRFSGYSQSLRASLSA